MAEDAEVHGAETPVDKGALAEEAVPGALVVAAGGRHHAQQPRRIRQVEAVHAPPDSQIEGAAAQVIAHHDALASSGALQVRREKGGHVSAQPVHLDSNGRHRGAPATIYENISPATGGARHAPAKAAVACAEVDEGELGRKEATAAHLLDYALVLQVVPGDTA